MTAPRSFKQELVCAFGQPIAENPTQYMIESAFRHHGLDWRYLSIEVGPEGLGDAVRGLKAMGFRGGNLTIPHKVAVIEHLDRLTDAAALMGAVNCIVREGDELVGENTDGKGFVESLAEVTDPSGKQVVILGAGGAARAITVELALAGASGFVVVNRSVQRGQELVDLLNDQDLAEARFVAWDGDYAVPDSTDVVINATSIGLFPDIEARVPLDISTLSPPMIVADVIPNPPRTRLVPGRPLERAEVDLTRLVLDAENAGCTVIDGLGMLVNQGVIGLKAWTGIDPDPGVMRAALEEVFG